jgi:hypothetical protein
MSDFDRSDAVETTSETTMTTEPPAAAESNPGDPPARPAQRWRGLLRRVLWPDAAVVDAREHGFDASKPGFAWFALARQIDTDLINFGELGRSAWSFLLLQCTALGFLVRAQLARQGQRSSEGPLLDSDWENLRTSPAVAEAWNRLTVAQAAGLVAWLGPEQNPTMLAGLAEQERGALVQAVRGLRNILSRPMESEARRLPRAILRRALRPLVAAGLLIVPLALAADWIHTKLRGPNLALHCAVTVSSQYSFEGTNHALLVDGDRTNLGFSTDSHGPQWVVIDLGKVRHFGKVVVYNRVDCCQSRATPLKLEVSDDNLLYRPLAERSETFDTWTAGGLDAEGRYVRLRNPPNTFFHLAEVEVYP